MPNTQGETLVQIPLDAYLRLLTAASGSLTVTRTLLKSLQEVKAAADKALYPPSMPMNVLGKDENEQNDEESE